MIRAAAELILGGLLNLALAAFERWRQAAALRELGRLEANNEALTRAAEVKHAQMAVRRLERGDLERLLAEGRGF